MLRVEHENSCITSGPDLFQQYVGDRFHSVSKGQLSKKIKQRKITIIFLSISLNMCFKCSKEPSHRDGSFEHHNICFDWEIRKIIFSYVLLSGGLCTRTMTF